MNEDIARDAQYRDSVPAIVRALAVLERLRDEPGGLTLSELRRDLRVSASSLLAILRTLASRGYLAHDASVGRYRLGPSLLELCQDTAALAVCWQEAATVEALAHALASTRLHPGDEGGDQGEILQALGRATRELSSALLGEAAAPGDFAAPAVVPWQLSASGPLGTEELSQFLGGDLLATLSCVKDDGYPHSVPVWYQWEDGCFWLSPRGAAAWATYVGSNPRVSLAISEHQPPLRRVLVEGKASSVECSDTYDRVGRLMALMATRYLGGRAGDYLQSTVAQRQQLFVIVPEKLVTWRGLAAHPRYAASLRQKAGGVA